MENVKQPTEEHKRHLLAILKLVMLVSALAVLYKTETGHLTSVEIGDIILGKMDLGSNDTAIRVRDSIRNQMENLRPEERQVIFNALLAYIDKNPSVEDLIDVRQVFQRVTHEMKELEG